MKTKLFKVVFIWIQFLSIFLLQPFQAYACSPVGPNPWFSTSLTFDKNTLPAGVEVVQTDPTYEPYALTNKNRETFYIVKKNNTDWKTFPNSELPRNYEPLYKLVNNQSFYYLNDEYSKPPTAGYKLNSGGINNSAATRVEIDERIYTLEGESKQIAKDDRPMQVDIPSPQVFSILAYYKGEALQIRGTLSYSLNEKYDPKAFDKGVKACAEFKKFPSGPIWTLISFIPIFILLSVVGIGGFIIYKLIKRFQK